MNPWKRESDFRVTAASWNWNIVMNTARCEGNCLQNFIESSAACSLLEVPVGACYPSGTQYYVFSLSTKACSLSHRRIASVNFVEQTWKLTNEKIWPLVETTTDQCWWHTQVGAMPGSSRIPHISQQCGCSWPRPGGMQPWWTSSPQVSLPTLCQQAPCCYNNLKLCWKLFFFPFSFLGINIHGEYFR